MPDAQPYRRTRRSPMPSTAEPFDDYAVDLGWYDDNGIGGNRRYLSRFGAIPAPSTLAELVTVAQQIAEAANGQIHGWRGQAQDWPVHSGGIRRAMQPWVRPFAADRQRVMDLLPEQLVSKVGKSVARGDDEPELWWNMRTYHWYLLNEARLRGFDLQNGARLNDLELLALLQHYGAATHLLDVSRDLLTALWFASAEHPDEIGVLIAFDDSGIRSLSAAGAGLPFEQLMSETEYDQDRRKTLSWMPRDVTPRVLAQRSVFLLSGYADQPWGSIAVTGTYAWAKDIEQQLITAEDARAFFIAVTPALKREVVEAGKAGVLGVDARSFFPDIVGFAKEHDATKPVPLHP